MKVLCLLVCLLSLLLLTACSGMTMLPTGALSTPVPGTASVFPQALEAEERSDTRSSALFFRLEGEPWLVPEYRVLQRTPVQSYETALLQALIGGPASNSPRLTGLFPEGTRVLSTSLSGRTLFVTLSQEILSAYPDEPRPAATSQEALLRRRLCMESLVLTVTENCDVDRVQILVEQKNSMVSSLRLPQRYFLETEGTDLAGPMSRDDTHLLTTQRALERILNFWKLRDWQNLYDTLMETDPATGLERSGYPDFVARMQNYPQLLEWSFSAPSISLDGLNATFAIHPRLLSGSQTLSPRTCTLRLSRSGGLWKISMTQLLGWLEDWL